MGSIEKPDSAVGSPHIGELMPHSLTKQAPDMVLDHTFEGGLRRAKRHMTESEAEKYLDGSRRIRIVKLVKFPAFRGVC